MVSDHDRRELYAALASRLGPGPADTLMELLPPVGWADVARRSDLVAVGGEMAELRGETAHLRAELKGDMADLRAELKGAIADLRAELKGGMTGLRDDVTTLRGELVDLRGEVRAQVPRLAMVNIATACGVAGLVLTAAGLS